MVQATSPWRILGGCRTSSGSRCRSIVPPFSAVETCSEVHGHLEKHHEGVLRNGGVARVCTDLLLFQDRERRDATGRERQRRKTCAGVTNDEQRRTKGDGRVGGVCSLLPGDRVHRLLVVDAPKSRIFEKPAEQTGRDSLFHRKLAREIGSGETKKADEIYYEKGGS